MWGRNEEETKNTVLFTTEKDFRTTHLTLVHRTFSVLWIPTSQASAPRLSSTNKLPVAADPTRDFGLKVKKPKRMQGILGTGLHPTAARTS